MTPLLVTAHLDGPVLIPSGFVRLDALLAWVVAQRDGLPPVDVDPRPIEIPIQRSPCGQFRLCSWSIAEVERTERGWTNQRFPVPEAQAMGGPKLRRLNVSVGRTKSYRIPREQVHLRDDRMDWACVGDAEEIRALLAIVGHVGKKAAVGMGRVASWSVLDVEPWGPGFPVLRDGDPLRALPEGYHGVTGGRIDRQVLTYPYHQRERAEMVHVPC